MDGFLSADGSATHLVGAAAIRRGLDNELVERVEVLGAEGHQSACPWVGDHIPSDPIGQLFVLRN
jgi:hypothetical protein